MCGFAGEYVFGAHAAGAAGAGSARGAADVELARRMAARLAHRGPDEQSAYLSPDGRLAIGFQRLAIIDVAGSHQPMVSADGRAVLAFNGEVYNFRQLRQRSQAAGRAFRTAGDTEALLAEYERAGADAFAELEGMFAAAIYDAPAGRLVLARDRLGQKPLWYALLADRVVFASGARAILEHPLVGRQASSEAISYYCTMGYVPAPHSIWQGIRKVLPGHWLAVLAGGAVQEAPYWRPAARPTPPAGSDADLLARVRDEVGSAVRSHMVADVPLGALLSGGVDSSIVAALMVREAGRAGGVQTFTAGFISQEYDERPAAAAVAKALGTDHRELLVSADPAVALDTVADMYDEPLADSSALPTYLICRAAREHVKVALAGDGGDEVFAGYDRYRAMRLGETMRPGRYLAVRLAAGLVRPVAPAAERSRLRRLVRFADGLLLPPPQQYLRYRAIFQPEDLPRLLTDDFAASVDLDGPRRWFCDLYESADAEDEVAYAQRHDLLTYLPDDLLVKTDIASMAASLELRAPLLDRRVVELGTALPVHLRVDGRQGKVALRRAFADLLPAEVFRRPKRGFGVPLAGWLRLELRQQVQQTLLDSSFLSRGIFRPAAVHGLINDHLTGRDDHSHRLWALLVLARWLARN